MRACGQVFCIASRGDTPLLSLSDNRPQQDDRSLHLYSSSTALQVRPFSTCISALAAATSPRRGCASRTGASTPCARRAPSTSCGAPLTGTSSRAAGRLTAPSASSRLRDASSISGRARRTHRPASRSQKATTGSPSRGPIASSRTSAILMLALQTQLSS